MDFTLRNKINSYEKNTKKSFFNCTTISYKKKIVQLYIQHYLRSIHQFPSPSFTEIYNNLIKGTYACLMGSLPLLNLNYNGLRNVQLRGFK